MRNGAHFGACFHTLNPFFLFVWIRVHSWLAPF
jgi:hypothetical protein